MYIVALMKPLTMSAYFFCQASVDLLINVDLKISAQRFNRIDIFSLHYIEKLSENTRINSLSIDIIFNIKPFFEFIQELKVFGAPDMKNLN